MLNNEEHIHNDIANIIMCTIHNKRNSVKKALNKETGKVQRQIGWKTILAMKLRDLMKQTGFQIF